MIVQKNVTMSLISFFLRYAPFRRGLVGFIIWLIGGDAYITGSSVRRTNGLTNRKCDAGALADGRCDAETLTNRCSCSWTDCCTRPPTFIPMWLDWMLGLHVNWLKYCWCLRRRMRTEKSRAKNDNLPLCEVEGRKRDWYWLCFQ